MLHSRASQGPKKKQKVLTIFPLLVSMGTTWTTAPRGGALCAGSNCNKVSHCTRNTQVKFDNIPACHSRQVKQTLWGTNVAMVSMPTEITMPDYSCFSMVKCDLVS